MKRGMIVLFAVLLMAVLVSGCATKVFAPEETSTPDPFGCDDPDLTDQQRAVCGVHVYDVKGEIVGVEGRCSVFITPEGESSTFEAEQEWALAFDAYWLMTQMQGNETVNKFNRRDEESYWMEKTTFMGDEIGYVIKFFDGGYEMFVSEPNDYTYECKHFVYTLK